MKHLQLEGQIVSDASGWLAYMLSEHCVKESYADDIRQSLELAMPLGRLRGYKKSSFVGLAADIGYVFLRNYAIYRCAEQEEYLFDYSSLLEQLQLVERFSDSCRQGLLLLREGKHRYRSRQPLPACFVSAGQIFDWIVEACPVLEVSDIDPAAPVRCFNTPYATLRDCEATLRVMGLFGERDGTTPAELHDIKKMILRPRDYSWSVGKIDDRWVAEVNLAISRLGKVPGFRAFSGVSANGSSSLSGVDSPKNRTSMLRLSSN